MDGMIAGQDGFVISQYFLKSVVEERIFFIMVFAKPFKSPSVQGQEPYKYLNMQYNITVTFFK